MRIRTVPWTCALLIAAWTAGCEKEVPEPEPPPLRSVRYVEVQQEGGARRRTFSGAARAGVETRLSFKVPGLLQSLSIEVGDRVRQGQVIATLDARDYEVRMEQARAGLAQANAAAANAEADFGRIRGLYERDNVSRGEYDSALARRDSARASVQAAQKQLEQAQLQLEYCTLASPVDGAVAETPVEVNENLQAGQPIALLTAGVLPEVEADIPEGLIGAIAQGQPVPRITFDAVPNRVFSGRVREVAVSPTQGLTTYPVTIQLSARDERIRPGMAAEVELVFPAQSGRRAVLPPHAVGEDRQGRFVYVVQGQSDGVGVVQRRPVEVGSLTPSARFGSALEVLAGIDEGEKVVTAGISQISDGLEVAIGPEESQ